MLITKEVEVGLSPVTINHYKELGYVIPEHKDSKGRITIKRGTRIIVNVFDLTHDSVVRVQIKCDGCGKKKFIPWGNYIRYAKENGEYYCRICACKLFGAEAIRQTALKNGGETFRDWCIRNDRQDVLDRFDYDKNKLSPDGIGYCSNKKFWFKCPRGLHKSELRGIAHLTSGRGDSFCCNRCNSIAQWGIDNLGEDFLEKYWSDENIGIDPWKISHGSRKYISIKCQKNSDHDDYEIICSAFSTGSRCQVCALEDRSGEGNPSWKGGISSLKAYLRATILQWKKDTMKASGFKCIITEKRFDVIHHLYGFDQILQETIDIVELPIYSEINKYTIKELNLFETTCRQLHEKYGLGVCLTKEMHNKFHLEYGYGNNNPQQFEKFRIENQQINNNTTS